MIHWHGLCWRGDKQPHQLLYDGVQNKPTDSEMAKELAQWAMDVFGMTASHPAGSDLNGNPFGLHLKEQHQLLQMKTIHS